MVATVWVTRLWTKPLGSFACKNHNFHVHQCLFILLYKIRCLLFWKFFHCPPPLRRPFGLKYPHRHLAFELFTNAMYARHLGFCFCGICTFFFLYEGLLDSNTLNATLHISFLHDSMYSRYLGFCFYNILTFFFSFFTKAFWTQIHSSTPCTLSSDE